MTREEFQAGNSQSTRPRLRFSDSLALGVWVGIVTGCLEAWITFGTRFAPAILPYRKAGSEILWVAPLAYAVVFPFLAAPLVFLSRLFKKQPGVLIVLGALSVVGFYTVLSYTQMIATVGVLSLSLAGAVVLCRKVRGREEAFVSFLRRYLLFAVMVVAVLGGGVQGFIALRERWAIGNMPAPSKDAPNVLVILVDTMRADRLSSAGYQRPTTPRIDAFALEGVQYERAYSTAPWTMPSHTTLLTGRFTFEHHVDYPVPKFNHGFEYLPEALAAYGYRSAFFSANLGPGTQEYLDAGFHHYDTYTIESTLSRMSLFRKFVWQLEARAGIHFPRTKHAPRITGPFLEWADRTPGHPFFALLNYIDVHDHYMWEWGSPPPFDTRFGDARGSRAAKKLPRTKERAHLYYDTALAYADEQIEILLKELQRRGLDKNTLVIFTSDHGESLLQHGFFAHASSLYVEQLHVPLILRMPGKVPPSVRVAQPVSLADLPSTVMHLLGLPSKFPGAPLPLVDQPSADGVSNEKLLLAEFYTVEDGPRLKSLMNSQWHYIVEYHTGVDMLFDLRADAAELHDLSQLPESAAVLAEFRKQMKTLFPQIAPPKGAAKAPGATD